MAKIVSTTTQLRKFMEVAIERAVEETAEELKEKLQECIDEEYYEKYTPMSYVRTGAFMDSVVAEMLDKATASIGISDDYFSYRYNARYGNPDGTTGNWTGEDQVYMADAGYHGNFSIYREGHFYQKFLEYCNDNAVDILKAKLKKYGMNVG